MNESNSSLVWILHDELLRTGESKVNKLSSDVIRVTSSFDTSVRLMGHFPL